MNATRLIGIVLVVAGVLGLVYRGVTYTKATHEAKLGPLRFAVEEKETIPVPVWAGVGAIAAGVILLVVGARKK